jgi:hypothetical protein
MSNFTDRWVTLPDRGAGYFKYDTIVVPEKIICILVPGGTPRMQKGEIKQVRLKEPIYLSF